MKEAESKPHSSETLQEPLQAILHSSPDSDIPREEKSFPEAARGLAALLSQGTRLQDAVLQIGCSPEEAQRWVNDPEFRFLIRKTVPDAKEIHQRLFDEAARSVAVVAELRDKSIDPAVRFRAATDILDRAGFTPIRRVATVSFSMPLDRNDLIKDTLSEVLKGRG